MAMSTLTSEAVTLAIENLYVSPSISLQPTKPPTDIPKRLLRGDHTASNLALCIILGVERSSPLLFESHLVELLQQVQMAAFSSKVK